MTILRLKKNHDRRVRTGHLWVFSNEVADMPELSAGSLVEVQSHDGESFGTGLFNPTSLIAVRLLQSDDTELDRAFFVERFESAKRYRERIFSGEHAYRFVFGESDFLPGLIIDRYDGYFAFQVLSAGMEQRLPLIIEALLEVFPDAKGIIEKNTSRLREIEGLELREGVLWGEVPEEILMQENGITYGINLPQGQKTGYFLDQKLNRKRVQELAKGLRVLDCFTNQGGFALNAARGGASHVLGIDSSAQAIERCRRNVQLNGFTNVEFAEEEVFAYLKREVDAGSTWDMVILDPPAFTKSRKQINAAKRGYEKINRLGMQLLPPEGLLVTGSCSHHISDEVFLDLIYEQALREGRQLRLVFRGNQSPDHPVLFSMPETLYLKFLVFEVL
jgi:23S rRNA (cytosine1962-C5)-methyltransferase